MNVVSVAEAAALLGVNASRLRALCAEGRVIKARKCGRAWLIPMPIRISPAPKDRRTIPVRLPISKADRRTR